MQGQCHHAGRARPTSGRVGFITLVVAAQWSRFAGRRGSRTGFACYMLSAVTVVDVAYLEGGFTPHAAVVTGGELPVCIPGMRPVGQPGPLLNGSLPLAFHYFSHALYSSDCSHLKPQPRIIR